MASSCVFSIIVLLFEVITQGLWVKIVYSATGDETGDNVNYWFGPSFNITGLTPGVNYTFTITAVAGSFTTNEPDVITNLTISQITTSSVFITLDEPTGDRYFFKGVPVIISVYTKPDVIRNLKADNITTSSILLKWTEPNGQKAYYCIEYENKSVTLNEMTFIQINNLIPGTRYTFKVYAVAADHVTQGRSNQISLYTKPDVIRNVTASEITTSSVFLDWDEPYGSRFFFKVRWTGDKTGRTVTNDTSYNITALTAGFKYTFIITVVAADNLTEADPVDISVYTKPDVIKNLAVIDVTTFSVFLTWDEPNGNRSFFHVQWMDDEFSRKGTASLTSYKITDLTSGVNYTFCIAVAVDNSTEGQAVCITKYTRSSVEFIWMVCGIILGVFCVLFTIIIIFWRMQRNKKSSDIPMQHIIGSIPLTTDVYEERFKMHGDSYSYTEEYEVLKAVGTTQSRIAALAVENKAKNRYVNVLPYDASRVKISISGKRFDDYINANYIPGYNSRKEFIAAQGPLLITVNEFWRMIWEKNVNTLVMLTKCHEQGGVKCEKYWPSGTNYYDNISVTTVVETKLDHWTTRNFNIKNVKTAETRDVRQFHFTAWPDHGVPPSAEFLIDFRQLVRMHMDEYSRSSPAVVHCSAGVGRTGTFIAIDRMILQIDKESMVDVYGIVRHMHMHRPFMVQNEQQYAYLHQCAYDIIQSRAGLSDDITYENTTAVNLYETI